MSEEMVASKPDFGRRRVVVVLGMHRSGTSLLTNLLNVLGVDLGSDLLAGDWGNEMGYWENESIYRTQDALMNHIAKDWGEYGFAYPFAIDWERLPEVRTYQDQLVSIVRSEIAGAKGIWGFKDPRTCRLLPMWKQIFAELDLEPLYVLAIRNPSDVVESLQKRNQIDPLHAELIWLLHNLEAVRGAGAELRVVVDYDLWFTSPCEQAKAVARALELTPPADDHELISRLTQTIRSDLRHSKERRPCGLPFVAKTYDALRKAAETGQAPGEIVSCDLSQSYQCLGAALELSSGAAEIALAVGQAELHAGNFEAALEAFTRATRLRPRLASARSGRSLALQMLNRPAEVLENVNRALSLDPTDAVALRSLARIQMRQGRLKDAEQTCRRILEQDPREAGALQMIDEILSHREKEKESANKLFGPGAKLVSAPTIVPAPIFVRKDRTRFSATAGAP